jgi:hypothetical protein
MKNQKDSTQEIKENKKLRQITQNLDLPSENSTMKKTQVVDENKKKKKKQKKQFKQKMDSLKEKLKGESKKLNLKLFGGNLFYLLLLFFCFIPLH